MDKHNNQQKNKSKNAKKPASSQAINAILGPPDVKDEAAASQGKKPASAAVKKK